MEDRGKIVQFPQPAAPQEVAPAPEQERPLTEAEQVLLEAWKEAMGNQERTNKILQRYAEALSQIIIFVVQNTTPAAQVQEVLAPHIAASISGGFLLGYFTREKVGKKGARSSK